MTSVRLTIVTPEGPLDLSVPAQLTIGQLLEVVTSDRTEPGAARGWTLTKLGGTPLHPSLTVELAGILDGTRLLLTRVGADRSVDRRPSTPLTRVSCRDRAARIIPDRAPTPERLVTALSALVGRHRPPGAGGPWDRMRKAWEWTDHERRLGWLLTRPRIRRSVFIAVVGHRSDELAESLADTLTAARVERVVLVDGGTAGAVSRRLRRAGAGFEAVESGLRRRDVTSIDRDLLFGLTELGTLTVPVDPSIGPPDADTTRRLCASLATHAGIIVVDCGAFEQPNAALLELADQIVVSTTRAIPHFEAQTIAALWGDIEPTPERDLFAMHRIGDDRVSVAELAVLVAAGWSAVEAATPVPLGL